MAEAASVCSKTSTSYRTVAKTSRVDESLFSSKTNGTKGHGKGSNGALKGKETAKAGPDVITLSKDQLQRMLKPSPVLTLSQVNALKQEAQEVRDKERAHSNARKARMLKMEEERKKQVLTVSSGQWNIRAATVFLWNPVEFTGKVVAAWWRSDQCTSSSRATKLRHS